MIIFGGDISMNGTGLTKLVIDDKFNVVEKDYLSFTHTKYISENSNGKVLYWKPEQFSNYIEKNKWFHDHIVKFLAGAEYGAIENYSFASVGQTFHIGEFTGVLKYLLYEMNIKIRMFAPTVVKKFASSYGGEGKTLVVDAYNLLPMSERFDLEYLLEPNSPKKKPNRDRQYESPTSDIVDSYWLSQCLLMELKLRNGILKVTDLDKKKKEIFYNIPKKSKINVIDSEFLQKVTK